MHIDYANRVMRIIWSTKQRRNHSKRRNCLLNTAYYRLWAGKHFAHYVVGQGIEGHGVSGAKEIFSQTLMIPRVHRIWETMRKKPKIVARTSLCGSQRHGSTMTNAMESDLPDAVCNVMQTDYQNNTPGIDKSCHMIYG